MGPEAERNRQSARSSDPQSSCRTPGMAGKKALVTFRISLPHNMRPHPQRIQLFGSWTSYTTSIPMERDVRAGHGIWKSGGPKGGLEQGAVYGYFYVMDGKNVWYDPAAGRTVRDDRTGKVVNVIEVPIELPSEEDQRIREKVSRASMISIMQGQSGKADGGGDIRGHDRSYDATEHTSRRRHSPSRRKHEQGAGVRGHHPPPPHKDYSHSPERERTAGRLENVPPTSSRAIVEQVSRTSLRQHRESISTTSLPPEQYTKQPMRRASMQPYAPAPSHATSRRKPVPSLFTSSRESHHEVGHTSKPEGSSSRRPYTFLGRKISIPSLPASPTHHPPGPAPPHPPPAGHFYSPYPPPPQNSSSAFSHHQTPSPTSYPLDSRGGDDFIPPPSKKESGSQRRRWSFLPQSGHRDRTPAPHHAYRDTPDSPAPNPSPKRRIGRLFSLSRTSYSNSATPRPELHTRSTSLTTNTAYTATTSVGSRRDRDRDTPSPLDIPPPPEFVRHRTRTRDRESRTRDRNDSMDVDREHDTQRTAKKNSDLANRGGGICVAAAAAAAQAGMGALAMETRDRLTLGAGRESPWQGLGAGQRISGQLQLEGRVRGSFLPDRETRLGNIMRDEERAINRRFSRSVSLAGVGAQYDEPETKRTGIGLQVASPQRGQYRGGDASSVKSGIHGGGFVMVGGGGTSEVSADGMSMFGGSSDEGFRGEERRRRVREEVVSTPGTIIRLDPDEFRPRKEELDNDGGTDIDLGNIGNGSGEEGGNGTTCGGIEETGGGRVWEEAEEEEDVEEGEEEEEEEEEDKSGSNPNALDFPALMTIDTLRSRNLLIDTRVVNTSPITIVPTRNSSADSQSFRHGRHGKHEYEYSGSTSSANNTATSTTASLRIPASPISPHTSHSNSPRTTPSSSYGMGGPKRLELGIGMGFLSGSEEGRVGGVGGESLAADSGRDTDSGGILMALDLDDGNDADIDVFSYFDGSDSTRSSTTTTTTTTTTTKLKIKRAGPGHRRSATLDAGAGAGTYDGPVAGKVRYLRSLKCLRDEAQGEMEGRREMWEELGWLGGVVV